MWAERTGQVEHTGLAPLGFGLWCHRRGCPGVLWLEAVSACKLSCTAVQAGVVQSAPALGAEGCQVPPGAVSWQSSTGEQELLVLHQLLAHSSESVAMVGSLGSPCHQSLQVIVPFAVSE